MSGTGLDLVVRARRAVVDGTLRSCSVGVRAGQIVAVTAYEAAPEAAEVIDLAADEVLLPGLVDTHVHVNEPGRTEWEGFATATAPAAAGGGAAGAASRAGAGALLRARCSGAPAAAFCAGAASAGAAGFDSPLEARAAALVPAGAAGAASDVAGADSVAR